MRTRNPLSGPQRGFSMIEALIAAALIGAVAVGVIPLFTRAMTDNMAGADYTKVTNYAKSKEEEVTRLSLTTLQSLIQPGQTQYQTVEYMDPATGRWTTTKPPGLVAYWTRTTTITQYDISDSDSNGTYVNAQAGTPVPAANTNQVIQIKVQVQSASSIGPIGTRRSTTIRYLKTF